MQPNPLRSNLALIAIAALLAANIALPFVFGDVYPFTSAPMFRDMPREYCNYRVFSPDGPELPPADWLVQRIYDGNPIGYGVGIRPPAILETEFGVIHDETTIRRHIEHQFAKPGNEPYDYVEIEQTEIGPLHPQHIAIIHTNRWRINRP